MQKKNYKEEHDVLPTDPLGEKFLSTPHQSSPTQLHCVKTHNTSNHKHRSHEKSLQTPVQQNLTHQEIQRTDLSVKATSSTKNDTLKIATVVQQIMTKLSEAVSEKGKENSPFKSAT
jgi:membrane-bound lytic murein transglycosylase